MERHEALKLVLSKLKEVVAGLKKVENKIKPAFKKKGWEFDVGVNLTGTAAESDVCYGLVVYQYAKEIDQREVITELQHTYLNSGCLVEIYSGPISYPSSSLLNLELLKDLQKSY